MAYHKPNAERDEFALEDNSKEAADWAGALIAQWANMKIKRDYAEGCEEAEADEDTPDHVTEKDKK